MQNYRRPMWQERRVTLIKCRGKTAVRTLYRDGSECVQPCFAGTTMEDPFARPLYEKAAPRVVTTIRRTHQALRRTRQRGSTTRSSASSGDDSDPEPPRLHIQLLDQAALADLLKISKHSVQNIYSATPHLLPPAIHIPGARGPRWTPQAVQEWLEQRPRHTPKPAPVAPKRAVGRPRIALRSAGGAA